MFLDITIEVQEQFHNFVIGDEFVTWDVDLHSRTWVHIKPLDHIFTDLRVDQLATEYFLPNYNMTGKAKYAFLTETGQADDIFTPKSFYAVNNFGYPDEN